MAYLQGRDRQFCLVPERIWAACRVFKEFKGSFSLDEGTLHSRQAITSLKGPD